MARSRKNLMRLVALAGLLAALLALLSVSARADTGGGGSLEEAVVEAMGVESDTTARSSAAVESGGRTQVNVMRRSGEWAFGAAVIEAPRKRGHYPKGWLFVAEDTGGDWSVELEGTPEFSDLASEAPASVVDAGEKRTFSQGASRTTQSTGPLVTRLMLPWRPKTAWRFTGGPHGWNTGFDRPYAALDFAGPNGGDQAVRAAGGGRVYTMCGNRRGWIRIYHPNGFATDYYHLFGNIRPKQGGFIRIGTVLGLTGNDVSCGGASFGRHVHFALLRGANHIPVHGKVIGGWRFVQGEAYRGYAHRGRYARLPGHLLYNFGPQ